MIRIIIIFLMFASIVFSQDEFERWEASEIDYVFLEQEGQVETNHNSILGYLRIVYTTLVSDVDGDNCPFSPSCSFFFVDAANKTNIFSASLLFADRFTRDSNIFKLKSDYSLSQNNRLIDPVDKYITPKKYYLNNHFKN